MTPKQILLIMVAMIVIYLVIQMNTNNSKTKEGFSIGSGTIGSKTSKNEEIINNVTYFTIKNNRPLKLFRQIPMDEEVSFYLFNYSLKDSDKIITNQLSIPATTPESTVIKTWQDRCKANPQCRGFTIRKIKLFNNDMWTGSLVSNLNKTTTINPNQPDINYSMNRNTLLSTKEITLYVYLCKLTLVNNINSKIIAIKNKYNEINNANTNIMDTLKRLKQELNSLVMDLKNNICQFVPLDATNLLNKFSTDKGINYEINNISQVDSITTNTKFYVTINEMRNVARYVIHNFKKQICEKPEILNNFVVASNTQINNYRNNKEYINFVNIWNSLTTSIYSFINQRVIGAPTQQINQGAPTQQINTGFGQSSSQQVFTNDNTVNMGSLEYLFSNTNENRNLGYYSPEYNVNYSGNDIASIPFDQDIPTKSVIDYCSNICTLDPRCMGYVVDGNLSDHTGLTNNEKKSGSTCELKYKFGAKTDAQGKNAVRIIEDKDYTVRLNRKKLSTIFFIIMNNSKKTISRMKKAFTDFHNYALNRTPDTEYKTYNLLISNFNELIMQLESMERNISQGQDLKGLDKEVSKKTLNKIDLLPGIKEKELFSMSISDINNIPEDDITIPMTKEEMKILLDIILQITMKEKIRLDKINIKQFLELPITYLTDSDLTYKDLEKSISNIDIDKIKSMPTNIKPYKPTYNPPTLKSVPSINTTTAVRESGDIIVASGNNNVAVSANVPVSGDTKTTATATATATTQSLALLVTKFIRIERDGTSNIINIREIEVFDDKGVKLPANMMKATLGPEYSSTTRADKIIDGDMKTIGHTTNSANAFIQIELNNEIPISKIKVYNRLASDCNGCDTRIRGTILKVLSSNNSVLYSNKITTAKPEYTFVFDSQNN